MEDLLVVLFGSKQLTDPERCKQDGLDRVLELQGRAGSKDIEISEDDAQAARLMALVVQLGHEALDPFRDVEGCGFGVEDRVGLERLRPACGRTRPAP